MTYREPGHVMSEYTGVVFEVDGSTSLYAIAHHPQTDTVVRKAALTLINWLRPYEDHKGIDNPTVADTYQFCMVSRYDWIGGAVFGESKAIYQPSPAPLYDIRNMGPKKAEAWFDLVTVAKKNDAKGGAS